jgi:hypothetical protein
VKKWFFKTLKEMKKLITTSILALLIAAGSAMRAQDWPEEYLGLPGDNLNLYAVMNLFQESETLEGFERNLNDENSRINNLDLNRDNMVDYITVSDYADGDVHTIVLRTALNRKESQDVAVFTVQRLRNGEVQIQLIGDEALYGRNYIIEPNYAETANPGYRGKKVKRANVTIITTTYYDIAAWPMIRFIYHPAYTGWHSSWYWGYYPVYWSAWSPWYWHYYYGYHYNWYSHYYERYRHWDHYRYDGYHNRYYGKIRTYSPTVVVNINKNTYINTYSRPEQRKEGEKLYASTITRRSTSIISSTAGNQERSTEKSSPAVQAKVTSRRAVTTATERTAASTASSRSAETARRQAATVTERKASSPATKSAVTARRSAPAAAERSSASPSATRSTETARRSAPAATARSAERPAASVQRTAPARSSGSSGQAYSASRSTSQASKSTPATKSSSNAKEQETTSTRRR